MSGPDFALPILMVAVGGATGGAGRYWLSGIVDRRAGGLFPWGTLVVNVSGALLMGGLAGSLSGRLAGATLDVAAMPAWTFLAVGVLGSYTTVSSFSLQTLALLRNGETRRALLNMGLSFGLCLTAAAAGYGGARLLLMA